MLSSRSIALALLVRASTFNIHNRLPVRKFTHKFADKKQCSESFDDILQDVLAEIPIDEKQSPSSVDDGAGSTGWRTIDWPSSTTSGGSNNEPNITHPPSPPVETILVRDRIVHIKRDDQLRLKGSQLSGNKARKMYALNQIPADEFPSCIVSYGGPQSNAMLAIAAVVRHKNDAAVNRQPIRFVYYTRTLPRFLRRQPTGNLYRALSLGMELIQVSPQEYHNLFGSDWGGSDEPPMNLDPPVIGDSVWVPQGGACSMAAVGLENLASEICEFWSRKQHGEAPLTVVLPGGTGATALLLNRAVQRIKSNDPTLDIEVAVVPCVGDRDYAERQMVTLNRIVNGPNATMTQLPTIVPPSPISSEAYFAFGEPHIDLLNTYQEMEEEHDLTLDLLYGAAAWTILFRHWPAIGPASSSSSNLQNRQLMYIHTGGLEGLGTQLLRYRYKGLLPSRDVQLPQSVLDSKDVTSLQTKIGNK